jgi:putative DNA primase/helicase
LPASPLKQSQQKALPQQQAPYYTYSEGQRVQRTKDKQFFSHHRVNSTDQWSPNAGEAPWPLYNEQVAIASGGWPFELEGEKCCDVASSIGLVAISQPGNKALLKPELVAPRYERLRGAGVEGIVYLADNDPQGKEKAIALQEVAEGIGLPFVLLAAELFGRIFHKAAALTI